MKIKNFSDFFESKSGTLYDYGCVMVYVRPDDWKSVTSRIDPEDLYLPNDPTYGIETSPHCTILYGLHPEVSVEDVVSACEGIKKSDIKISIEGIGSFENPEYEVVKMNVESPVLRVLNSRISELPHTTDYPDYRPHITVAYVKSGTAGKYVDPDYRKVFSNIDKIVYSKTNGETVDIPLI